MAETIALLSLVLQVVATTALVIQVVVHVVTSRKK